MDLNVNFGQRIYADNKVRNNSLQTVSFKADMKADSFESSSKKEKSNKLKTAAKIGMVLALGPIIGGAVLLLKHELDKQKSEPSQQPVQPQQPSVENREKSPIEEPQTVDENKNQTPTAKAPEVTETPETPNAEAEEKTAEEKPAEEDPVTEEPVAEENIPADDTPASQTERTEQTAETQKAEKIEKTKPQKQHGAQVRKSDFKGIDYAVVERFKVDINKFNSTDDLQTWAENKIGEIKAKDYSGRDQLAKIQRREMLKEWYEYVIDENDAYKPTVKLMILTAITKDLKPATDMLPPVLNRGVLADTIAEVTERYSKNPKETIDIKKLYETKLSKSYSCTTEDGEIDKNLNGWIKIPSKEHDPEHFEENVAKMKVLSHRNWCTKSFNAEPYLSKGDFHIYFENGKQKLAVRFEGDKVVELEGEINNRKVPQKYLETAKQYIADNNFELDDRAESQIKTAEKAKVEIEKMKKAIGEEAIEKADIEKILPYMGIDVKKDADGKYIISEFAQPFVDHKGDFEPAYFKSVNDVTYDDLGVDENKLLKNVKKIEGHCDLRSSSVVSMENLEYVGQDLICNNRRNINLKNIKEVGEDVHCDNTSKIDLSSLETVGKSAHFKNAEDVNLSKLRHVKESANFEESKFENIDSLEDCGTLNIKESQIKSMKNLATVRGDIRFNPIIQGFENLQNVDGDLNLRGTDVVNLPKLKTIGGELDVTHSKIKSMNVLEIVGKDLNAQNAEITEMNNLKTIGGNAYLDKTKIKQLDNLFNVGGILSCTNSKLMSMKWLHEVGRHFYAYDSLGLECLNSLRTVGGDLSLFSTHVRSLPRLETVGGDASLHGMYSLRYLDKLKTVGGNLDVSCDENLYSLDSLETVGGSCCFANGRVCQVPRLMSVGGTMYINRNYLMDKKGLPLLSKVGGDKFYLGEKMDPEDFKNIEFNGTYYKNNQPVSA